MVVLSRWQHCDQSTLHYSPLHMSESNIAKRIECNKFNRFLPTNDKVCLRKILEQKFAQKDTCEELFKFLRKYFLSARISKNLARLISSEDEFDS